VVGERKGGKENNLEKKKDLERLVGCWGGGGGGLVRPIGDD